VDTQTSQLDADSPINTTLVTYQAGDIQYNYDHALRGGTDGAAVRLAVARGNKSFSKSSVAPDWYTSETISFSDAEDGDPNFSDTPHILVSVYGEDFDNEAHYHTPPFSFWVEDASSTGCEAHIQFGNNASINVIGGFIWVAFGPVSYLE
jgi:hypothetical protein